MEWVKRAAGLHVEGNSGGGDVDPGDGTVVHQNSCGRGGSAGVAHYVAIGTVAGEFAIENGPVGCLQLAGVGRAGKGQVEGEGIAGNGAVEDVAGCASRQRGHHIATKTDGGGCAN